ncbi:MAG: phosphatase PAP2 family protein [Chryseolinea sp.]
MISKILLIITLLVVSVSSATSLLHAQGQSDSTTRSSPVWKKTFIASAALISSGLFATTDNDIFDRKDIAEQRNALTPRFQTHADDYIQYAPILIVYGLNAIGVKGRHDMLNQTILLIKSELIMTAIIFPLKKLTAIPRPDTGAPNSFPSGHTAQAFAAATFLHKEYGKNHPIYSIIAYTTASGIGVLRMLNNRHWTSDVLVGAGIGILSTNLAYMSHENRWHNRKKKAAGMIIMPTYGAKVFGMYMALPI